MTNEPEARKRPGVERAYRNDRIVVRWEPALCIHAGRCYQTLPATFDPTDRPWVRVDAASADQIEATVLLCPTGALSYERLDSPAQETETPVVIEPRRNGPLFVRGEVEVVDGTGRTVRRAVRLALCRCGASGNKPYCDLSHRQIDFRSD